MLNNCKVLVTGLTGNLGGSLVEGLLGQNEVWGFARFSREGQRAYWEGRGVHTVVGDCAEGSFTDLPDDFDYVVHSGANTSPATFQDGLRDNSLGAALLMAHCRKAKGFLHVSATAVYASHPDPMHCWTEDDPVGSANIGHYNGTKLAGEGAVHAMSVHLGLPTIICRLGVQYGPHHKGGLPGIFLRMILNDEEILLPGKQSNTAHIISDDDIVRFLEPLLNAATVPATIVNLGGDVIVNAVELIELFGKLAGKTPKYRFTDEIDYPSARLDPTRRQAITGPCQVDWREGVTRQYEALVARGV
jgi:UDP-glucuronate 4-epimerase